MVVYEPLLTTWSDSEPAFEPFWIVPLNDPGNAVEAVVVALLPMADPQAAVPKLRLVALNGISAPKSE